MKVLSIVERLMAFVLGAMFAVFGLRAMAQPDLDLALTIALIVGGLILVFYLIALRIERPFRSSDQEQSNG